MANKGAIGIKGKVLEGGQVEYAQKLPYQKGDEVVILKRNDLISALDQAVEAQLDLIAKKGLQQLMSCKFPMEPLRYAFDKDGDSEFPDEIQITLSKKQKTKMFLNHYFYSTDPSKYMAVFYVSVDQAEAEHEYLLESQDINPPKDIQGQKKLF